jgi:hypothetical protein
LIGTSVSSAGARQARARVKSLPVHASWYVRTTASVSPAKGVPRPVCASAARPLAGRADGEAPTVRVVGLRVGLDRSDVVIGHAGLLGRGWERAS